MCLKGVRVKEFLTSPATDQRSYSRAVVVPGREYNTLYLCGVVNHDKERNLVRSSFEDGVRTCFERLSDTVMDAGGDLSDIVTMTVYITDPRFGDDFVRLRAEYFEAGRWPASALITVSGLGGRDFVVEIQAIAAVANG